MNLNKLSETLQKHCLGRQNGRSVEALALIMRMKLCDSDFRKLRAGVKELRMRGLPICAHPSDGYYWAEHPAEIAFTIEFLRGRALSSLLQISRLKRYLTEQEIGQLKFDLDLEPEPDFLPFQGPSTSYKIDCNQELIERLERLVSSRCDLDLTQALNEDLTHYLSLEEIPSGKQTD
jgi:hypothetical protein